MLRTSSNRPAGSAHRSSADRRHDREPDREAGARHSPGLRRIALVTHGFDIGGGVPTVARWLYAGLEALGGYQVDIHDLATSRMDRYSRRLTAPGTWPRGSLQSTCGVRQPPHRHWGANGVELEPLRYRPRTELTDALRGYDLVQVVAGSPAWAHIAARCAVPTVLQAATLVRWERRSQLVTQALPMRTWRGAMTRITTAIERSALTGADAVLVENDEMLRYVRAHGQSRVVRAAPGVDTTMFCPDPGGWRRDGHLLSVCRLADPRKGLVRTVRAYAEVVRRDDRVPPLVLAGRGALPEPVRQLVAALGLTRRVTVRTDVRTAELLDLYRGASVFLQTSYEEGLGMSVLEAMACGLPVVATRTAGSQETVRNGVTGWLVGPPPGLAAGGDADVVHQIADRVLGILRDPDCPFGACGRARCLAEFSTGVALRRFTAVYDELLRPR